MSSNYSEVVNIARDYYNSDDADNFYAIIWGGEDIHIGLYETIGEPITDASHRTVRHMLGLLDELNSDQHVLDIGSGYGGAARYLTTTTGCHVTALNLSEKENERHRSINEERGLTNRIDVVDGSFEAIPAEDNSYDVVWSQDAILHSGHREDVLKEVARVLKPGGHFIFTDPMQADDCPPGVLKPILERIHLPSLASPAFYREQLGQHGFKEVLFEDQTQQLVNHYTRVRSETASQREALEKVVSPEYIDRMINGLGHWVDGGSQGYLSWGIFIFQK